MSTQHCPEQGEFSKPTLSNNDPISAESDEEFLRRQFQQSITALERVHALSSGEFDRLVQSPVHTEEGYQQRATHHEDIARQAFRAAQRGQLSEEEFNIWSGRRKENGQPVKFRFERAYANASTPLISCMRGALTGIVRAYVRLQDEAIANMIAQAENATTAEELLEAEQYSVRDGFLVFELYACGSVAGWPCFPRSTGRFRGATRLRQFFEQRQAELPMSEELAQSLKATLVEGSAESTSHGAPMVKEQQAGYVTTDNEEPAPFKRIISRISKIFR